MFEVSLDNTLTGLKQGKIAQTICRLVGSKTGKHKVKTLKGEAKKKYYSIPESDRLTKHDIEQGTITVSNLGSICRDWQGACTLLEIIPPQTCAIAIGSIQKKPVCDENGNVVAGNVMPLTLAFGQALEPRPSGAGHRLCPLQELYGLASGIKTETPNSEYP